MHLLASARRGVEFLSFIWSHPANRSHGLRAVAKALAWQAWKRATGLPLDLSVWNGVRVRCYPDSASASLLLYCSGLSDPMEMPFVRHYLRPGDRFLDVGANIGVYTLLAASRVGAQGRVDAFEPSPRALSRLAENLALNRFAERVRVHAAAVSDSAGTVRFTIDKDSMNHIARAKEAEATVPVPAVCLDEAVAGTRYAMGKLDAEGAELRILQGAERMVRAGIPPVWLIEIARSLHEFGASEKELVMWLRQRGYRLATYEPKTRALCFCSDDGPWDGNYLAIAAEAVSMVQARVQAAPD